MERSELNSTGLDGGGRGHVGDGRVVNALEDAAPDENLKQKPLDTEVRCVSMVIAVRLLVEALFCVMEVLMRHISTQVEWLTVLAVVTLLVLAGLGLLRMKRWGGALALAALFLSGSSEIYGMLHYHQNNWLQLIGDFIFFFYLVRPKILRRLR